MSPSRCTIERDLPEARGLTLLEEECKFEYPPGHRQLHFPRRTPGVETMHASLDDFFERSLLLAGFAIADERVGSRLELADAFFRTDEDDVRIREETERVRTLG